MELMNEFLRGNSIAFLMNPKNPLNQSERRDAEVASRALGQRLEVLMASNDKELEAAFSALKQRSAGALIIASDQFYFGRMREIAMLAGRQAFRLLGRYGSLPRKAG
jgi:putative ABC transport system substrate-binding protein